MPNKYLPLGSIVRVNNISKNIMITGYYSLEYNNSVRIYDYVGCSYPEGLLIKNNSYSFNHSDIQRLIYKGYQDDDFSKLNSHLLNQLNDDYDNLFQPKSFVNLKFDKNGVVVYDEISDVDKPAEIVDDISNPFTKELVNKSEEVKPNVDNKARIKNVDNSNLLFSFDANGFVTGEIKNSTNDKPNLEYEFDENGVVTGIKDNNESKVVYKFDANGNVIAEDNLSENLENSKPQYKFDANGNVIAEDNLSENLENSKPQYKFDENGIVMSEEVLTDNSHSSEEPEDLFVMPHYKFGPSGIIIE